ncbi:hypothetical protein DsansV1_C11g0109291 [Dioscorea sansibarensis]
MSNNTPSKGGHVSQTIESGKRLTSKLNSLQDDEDDDIKLENHGCSQLSRFHCLGFSPAILNEDNERRVHKYMQLRTSQKESKCNHKQFRSQPSFSLYFWDLI